MPAILVTSASRGIGREFVRQFAADGWQVVAGCRDPGAVEAELRALGDGVHPVAMDVTDLASVEAAARARGCAHVFVTSFTFQAPGFYERRGYREIFRWEGVPTADEADVHLRKEL